MASFNFQAAWNTAIRSANYTNPVTALWQGTNDVTNAGLSYYENKIAKEKATWGCKDEPVALSPKVTGISVALKGLSSGLKGSICKHITQSNSYKIYEAFKAFKGILNAAPVVAGMAAFNFLTGSIAAILPSSVKGHFLKAVTWVNQQVYFLLNFNIQMTDDELDKQSYRFIGLAGQTGEVLGKSVGWVACGLSATAGVAVINKAQAAKIMAEVGAEGLEEISAELWALAKMGQRQAQRAAFLQIFKNARRWLKDPTSPFYPLLVAKFGKKTIDQWGNAGNKPWSVNTSVQEWIETFKDEALKDFLEEAYEGLIEGCQESFLCFAGAFSQDLVPRPQRTVEINYKQLPALNAT